MKVKLRNIDYWILIPCLLLCCIGIVAVYSASSSVAVAQGLKSDSYLVKQLINVMGGLVLCALFYFMKINNLKNNRFIQIYFVAVVLMLMYLLVQKRIDPASAVNGASAWIHLGPINIQPLELAKLFLVLYLAKVFSNRILFVYHERFLHKFSYLWQPILIASVIVALTVLQPDIGGAVILLSIVIVMTLASGFNYRYSIAMIAFLVVTFAVTYMILSKSISPSDLKSHYELRRVVAFMHPFKLEQTGGSQLVNSYYAINNGGFFGRGIGNSIQKLGYLPEPYTDFILSIISEELGVVGVVGVLSLLLILIGRIIVLGILASSSYLSLLSYGIATTLFVQTAFNVGGVLGLLPITGVTLPFISYGGSSILVLAICIGIMLNVSVNIRNAKRLN